MAACLNNGGGDSRGGSGGNGAGGGASSGNGPGRTASNDTLLWTPRTGEVTTRQPGSTWREIAAAPASSGVLPWRGGIDAGGSSFPGHGLVVPTVGRVDGGGGGVGTVGYGSGGMGAMLTSKPRTTSNGRNFEATLPPEGQFGTGPGYHPMRSVSALCPLLLIVCDVLTCGSEAVCVRQTAAWWAVQKGNGKTCVTHQNGPSFGHLGS